MSALTAPCRGGCTAGVRKQVKLVQRPGEGLGWDGNDCQARARIKLEGEGVQSSTNVGGHGHTRARKRGHNGGEPVRHIAASFMAHGWRATLKWCKVSLLQPDSTATCCPARQLSQPQGHCHLPGALLGQSSSAAEQPRQRPRYLGAGSAPSLLLTRAVWCQHRCRPAHATAPRSGAPFLQA